tara:strand:- start:80 stop:715 length:636 start_codon:yes stop_codon:yes gene_type:complete
MPDLTIETFCLGDWMTNCYVIHESDNCTCWIIDAGFEPQPMIDYIRDCHLQPEQIVLTHAHIDHIAGLHHVRTVWSEIPIMIHLAEIDFLTDPLLNLSVTLSSPVVAPEATQMLVGGQVIRLGQNEFQVRHTPGHSPGGISLVCVEKNIAFVGDALFSGSIGRTDFPTSDSGQLITSIREQLLGLSDQTRVLPGHGPPTTIGVERSANPFL